MPECYIDSTLVGQLLDADVSHKHSCNEVAKAMEKGPYKDEFAVGIIDNDKRKIRYIESFEEIGRTENLTFLKHRVKHHYMIKVAKEGKAMETFIIANVEAIGMKMEDFDKLKPTLRYLYSIHEICFRHSFIAQPHIIT